MRAQAFFSSSHLQRMNWRMSGCSALRMTIFAARRVLPPLLMTPANASKPFMKETGPDAVPPPARCSRDERSEERLLPVPEPYLKSIPSVFASPRMDSMESSTELMKHAEHCGRSSTPTLNQTGELKDAFWRNKRWVSSARNTSRSPSVAKYPPSWPHAVMVSTTRATSLRAELSRSGVPGAPRKYLEATTLVARSDHALGTSTFFCSKTGLPSSPVMEAGRSSHAIS